MDILGNVQKIQQPVINKILPARPDLRDIQTSKHGLVDIRFISEFLFIYTTYMFFVRIDKT